MGEHYILLRPEHKNEKEKRKENNGHGFRTGFILKYPLLDGLELVNNERQPFCYQKIGNTRERVSLSYSLNRR